MSIWIGSRIWAVIMYLMHLLVDELFGAMDAFFDPAYGMTQSDLSRLQWSLPRMYYKLRAKGMSDVEIKAWVEEKKGALKHE